MSSREAQIRGDFGKCVLTPVLEGKVLWSWRGTQALVAAGWQPADRRRVACWEEVVAAARVMLNPTATMELVGRLQVVLRGNQGSVFALAISPDRRLLASGSEDGIIRLWELPGGTEQAILHGHE